ncbi:hypothetical protein E5676_scaffold475G002500 [Cucumis melo var. makuwa]|uniref:Uncharacterized protein n=1 Tax=Cucumis melo var. makuwa TaxID=1194695 RepID=A0A5D3CFX3_CUCMM|nr:hypothetical protein E5676_scaffold475G002500 [Cucumis melo var. makuwa]
MALHRAPLLFFLFLVLALASSSTTMATSRAMLFIAPTPTMSTQAPTLIVDAKPSASSPPLSEATLVAGFGSSSTSMPPSFGDFVAFEVPSEVSANPPTPDWMIRSCKPKGRMRYSAPSDRRNSEPLISIVCSNMS